MSGQDKAWDVKMSVVSSRTSNPIRAIVDRMGVHNPAMEIISLSIGDPTRYGNLPCPASAELGVANSVKEGRSNGYGHSCGTPSAREAVARAHSSSACPLTAEDVILASGCSGALDLCIAALANEGDEILLPRPGFSLYQTLCDSRGIKCVFYDLLPEKDWEIDLEALGKLVTPKTRALLINNPSNPCGSVFSRDHLVDIAAFAENNKLPLIADEIYAHMTFKGIAYHSVTEVAARVPVLVTGGLAKRYMVPGWRLGWVLIHDPVGAFVEVRKGLLALTTLILGPNSVTQAAIPYMLEQTDPAYHEYNLRVLQENAEYCVERLKDIAGLSPIIPQGAMYLMVRVEVDQFDDKIEDDVSFSNLLFREQSVHVLPGQCFNQRNFFRVVVCAPKDTYLKQAFDRIDQFCKDHQLRPSKRQKRE